MNEVLRSGDINIKLFILLILCLFSELLKAYAQCATSADVVSVQAQFMAAVEQERKDRLVTHKRKRKAHNQKCFVYAC